MVKPRQLAKRKIIEFLFLIGVILEHTLTIAVFMIGIFALDWLAIKLNLAPSYPVFLLREISEYALLGIYMVFVIAGIIYIYTMFKDLEVE